MKSKASLGPPFTANAPLRVTDLNVTYPNGVNAVRGVSLQIEPGEIVGLVGESGCGKSTLGLAVLGLLDRKTGTSGEVVVEGTEMNHASQRVKRELRGAHVGFVAQNPLRSFDPLMKVARSVAEAWAVKGQHPPTDAVSRALEQLGIDDAERRGQQFPHQWSGGMLQRAAIAAAAALAPALVVADEPTSALDADRADIVLRSLKSVGTAVLLISHDLTLVSRFADTIAVMYAGRLVESGSAEEILQHPSHPYTAALLEASPRPGMGLPNALPGAPPRLDHDITACSFAPRCSRAEGNCHLILPPAVDGVECIHPLSSVERPDVPVVLPEPVVREGR